MSKMVVARDVKKFRDAFIKGIEGIVTAAEIYVASIDENPHNAEVFKKELGDWIPASAWSGFEAVGRKWMHPKLLMGGMADRKKNTIVKRLPYSVQEQVFNGGRFEYLTKDGRTLKVAILEATHDQAEQICDGGTIRNISAQKAYQERNPIKEVEAKAEILPYTILGGKITFRRGTVMTKRELKRLMEAI